MSYKAHTAEIHRAIVYQTYEDFRRIWDAHCEPEFKLLIQDEEFIGSMYEATLSHSKSRILAFLLSHSNLPLNCKFFSFAKEQHYLPIYVVESFGFLKDVYCCNVVAVLRLLLYMRGIKPFFTVEPKERYSAEECYTRGVGSFITLDNGQTIKKYLESTWQEIQEHDALLAAANQLVEQKRYHEAYQKYDAAVEQLEYYSEGDKDLAAFYEEEQWKIYEEAIVETQDDRLEMVSYIATSVLPKLKHLPKTHFKIQFFETIMRCPAPASSGSSDESTPPTQRRGTLGRLESALRRRKGYHALAES